MLEKICIVGTHHDYQLNIRHPQLFQALNDYIEIHSLQNPLVAEEATENDPTLIKEWALSKGLVWLPVELDGEFRKQLAMDQGDEFTHPVPFTDFREWVWLIRIMRSQVTTCLFACGYTHATGISRKFMDIGVTTTFETFWPIQPFQYHAGEARVSIRCPRCKQWVQGDKIKWIYPPPYFMSQQVCERCAASLAQEEK
jgi:hypothetical protein